MGLAPVIDGHALMGLCEKVRRVLGSEPKAAEALGISQPHFHRLRTGQIPRRVHSTLRGRLWTVLLARAKAGDLERNRSLFSRSFEGAGPARLYQEMQKGRQYERPARAYHEKGAIGRATAHVQKRLCQMGYGSFFRAYRDAARDKHRSLPQIALGISRALEALVAGDLTPNSVGLRIKELEDAGLLKRYLGAAFKAESLLLR